VAYIYLSLGTNIEPKKLNILNALNQIKEKISIIDLSPPYMSDPVGFESSSIFINLVLKGKTDLKPYKLLEYLKETELKLGRKSTNYVTDRIIDIDIIFYEDEVINSVNLTIPHPRARTRRFVLQPLYDINKNIIFPDTKETIIDLLKKVKTQKLSQIKSFYVENS
jgi:2-amino-4-hydroxy-6-hydroxymethyldihydropteridine diphosphokinase